MNSNRWLRAQPLPPPPSRRRRKGGGRVGRGRKTLPKGRQPQPTDIPIHLLPAKNCFSREEKMDMGLSFKWTVNCVNLVMQFEVFTAGMWIKFWDQFFEQNPNMSSTVKDKRFEALKEALSLWDLRLVPIFEGEEELSPSIVNRFNAIIHYYSHFHRGFCYRKVNSRWLDENGEVISVDQCCGYLRGMKELGEVRFYAVDGKLNLDRDEIMRRAAPYSEGAEVQEKAARDLAEKYRLIKKYGI